MSADRLPRGVLEAERMRLEYLRLCAKLHEREPSMFRPLDERERAELETIEREWSQRHGCEVPCGK